MLTLSCHGHVLSHGPLQHHGDDDAQGNEDQGNGSAGIIGSGDE
jgi:hypothetical protein